MILFLFYFLPGQMLDALLIELTAFSWMKWVISPLKFHQDGTIDLWQCWSKLIHLDYLIPCCRTPIFLNFNGKKLRTSCINMVHVVKRPFLINSFCFKIWCTLSKFSTSQANFYLRSDIKFTKIWNENALHYLFSLFRRSHDIVWILCDPKLSIFAPEDKLC